MAEENEYLENLRNLALLQFLITWHQSSMLSKLLRVLNQVVGSDHVKVLSLPLGLTEVDLPKTYKYDAQDNLKEIIITDEKAGWEKHVYYEYDAKGNFKTRREEVKVNVEKT